MLRLRRLPDDHQCTLVCRDLSDLGTLAQVNNPNYRLLKKTIPGPFTFILEASREVPKRLVQPEAKDYWASRTRLSNHTVDFRGIGRPAP